MRMRVRVVGAGCIVVVMALGWLGTTRGELRPPDVHPAGAGPAVLGIDRTRPNEPASLLFLGTRAASPVAGEGRIAIAPDGGALLTNMRLQVRYLALPTSDTTGAMIGIAADRDGWWVTTSRGQLLHLDTLLAVRTQRDAPFPATAVWPLSEGGVIAVRSPDHFSFAPEPIAAPLLTQLGEVHAPHQRGVARVPAHALLASVANAGTVVQHGDAWIFAPVGGHHVIALTRAGDTLWRQDGPSDAIATPEPRFVVDAAGPRVAYQPWNLALSMGPDGLVYRLRATDTSLTGRALDVLDPNDGRLLRTATLGSEDDVLAVNAKGRLYGMNMGTLLGAMPPEARAPFPTFAFTNDAGQVVSARALQGRITLINFWASWCLPCRQEMPALDALSRSLRDDSLFATLGINVDASRGDARTFLGEVPISFPTIFGGPDLGPRFGYAGLPYTALVDAEGRIVRRFLGALTPSDIAALGALAREELARLPRTVPQHVHGH